MQIKKFLLLSAFLILYVFNFIWVSRVKDVGSSEWTEMLTNGSENCCNLPGLY